MPKMIPGMKKTDWNDVLMKGGVNRLTNEINESQAISMGHISSFNKAQSKNIDMAKSCKSIEKTHQPTTNTQEKNHKTLVKEMEI